MRPCTAGTRITSKARTSVPAATSGVDFRRTPTATDHPATGLPPSAGAGRAVSLGVGSRQVANAMLWQRAAALSDLLTPEVQP